MGDIWQPHVLRVTRSRKSGPSLNLAVPVSIVTRITIRGLFRTNIILITNALNVIPLVAGRVLNLNILKLISSFRGPTSRYRVSYVIIPKMKPESLFRSLKDFRQNAQDATRILMKVNLMSMGRQIACVAMDWIIGKKQFSIINWQDLNSKGHI